MIIDDVHALLPPGLLLDRPATSTTSSTSRPSRTHRSSHWSPRSITRNHRPDIPAAPERLRQARDDNWYQAQQAEVSPRWRCSRSSRGCRRPSPTTTRPRDALLLQGNCQALTEYTPGTRRRRPEQSKVVGGSTSATPRAGEVGSGPGASNSSSAVSPRAPDTAGAVEFLGWCATKPLVQGLRRRRQRRRNRLRAARSVAGVAVAIAAGDRRRRRRLVPSRRRRTSRRWRTCWDGARPGAGRGHLQDRLAAIARPPEHTLPASSPTPSPSRTSGPDMAGRPAARPGRARRVRLPAACLSAQRPSRWPGVSLYPLFYGVSGLGAGTCTDATTATRAGEPTRSTTRSSRSAIVTTVKFVVCTVTIETLLGLPAGQCLSRGSPGAADPRRPHPADDDRRSWSAWCGG